MDGMELGYDDGIHGNDKYDNLIIAYIFWICLPPSFL